jgi:hypothetical protein
MPIPKPNSGETESDFVSRCIEQIFDEYGEEQSAAICYNTFKENNMSKTTAQRVNEKMNLLSKMRGIKLLPNGEVNMIDPNPCWEGYEAIGTKIVDGREVPNCVPIAD